MSLILIVEDDSDLMEINKRYLTGQGYSTIGVETIKDAEFQLEECSPDLILLDVKLPDGNGKDFCRTARKITSAPIIFLSSCDDNEDIIEGLSNGGDDYIIKPCDLSVLNAKIISQLRRYAKNADQIIELPDLKVDMISGTACLDGNECSLPLRELQILYMLASKCGSRIGYREIYLRIYGCDVEDSKNTIRVNISRLKKHLQIDDGSTYEICRTKNEEYLLRRVCF